MNLNEGRWTDRHPSEKGALYSAPEHPGNEKANKTVDSTRYRARVTLDVVAMEIVSRCAGVDYLVGGLIGVR